MSRRYRAFPYALSAPPVGTGTTSPPAGTPIRVVHVLQLMDLHWLIITTRVHSLC